MTVSYNHLNLPTRYDFGGGKFIDILYNASGTKLSKQVSLPPTDPTPLTTYTGDQSLGPGALATGTYSASGVLSVTSTISSGSQVSLQGGSKIVFGAGFRVDNGAILQARVGPGTSGLERQDYLMQGEYKNRRLEAVYHPEGRLYYPEIGKARYEYTLRDHPSTNSGQALRQAQDRPRKFPDQFFRPQRQQGHRRAFGSATGESLLSLRLGAGVWVDEQ